MNLPGRTIRFWEKIIISVSKNWRVYIYGLCGLGLCWVDLWRGIGNGAQWALAVNCTGFCIFPLIIFRLDWKVLILKKHETGKWQRLFRVLFYSWILLFMILAYPVFEFFAPGTDYDAQIASAIANVGLYGALLVRMYFYLFYEKKEDVEIDKRKHKVTLVFWLWFAFIVLAIASVNKSLWPIWFMVMFGSFYLAPLQSDDLKEIVEGLTSGMLIGFFWIQSRAFLYRPFDGEPRYRGHYTNENVNAMFYLFIYCAWLIKLSLYRLKNAPKRYAFAFFMASSMWAFVFFTGCRSAWLGFLGVTLVYWIIESGYIAGRSATIFFKRGFMMFACFIVSFVPVFLCIRYIPPLRHHPIWYGGEYAEWRVMAWDPADSDKYVDFDEAMTSILGRFYLTRDIQTDQEKTSDIRLLSIVASLSETELMVSYYSEDGEKVLIYTDGIQPGSDSEHPIYINEDYKSNLLRRLLKVRYYVYRYTIDNIHIWGNKELASGIWLLSSFPFYHAHNTVLQMMFWFGPVAGIVFLGLQIVNVIIAYSATCSRDFYVAGLFAGTLSLGYLLMGLTECVAFPGEMGMTLFFVNCILSTNPICKDAIKPIVQTCKK